MLAKKLKYGDTIGLIAPSFALGEDTREKLQKAVSLFNERGFKIKCGRHIFENWYGSAGTPQQRAEDLNAMFADSDVDAIICINGGGTSNMMLPYTDFDTIGKNPKIFMGYSDISVLNQVIYDRTGLVTFNGPLFMDFVDEKNGEAQYANVIERFVEGSKVVDMGQGSRCVRGGRCEGVVMGTNIKCSMNLLGTPYLPDYTDKIAFLEAMTIQIFESTVRIAQLKQQGFFDRIKGVCIGYIINLQESLKTDKPLPQFEDILLEMTEEYDFPILKCNIFGHEIANAVLPIGVRYGLDADERKISILEDFLL